MATYVAAQLLLVRGVLDAAGRAALKALVAN